MTDRIDRVNRVVFVVLGALLVAVGAGALLLGGDVFGDGRSREVLLQANVRQFVDRNHGWFWLAAGGALALVVLLSLWWLLRQASTGRLGGELDLEPDREHGRTLLEPGAVTDAVVDDVEGYRGVTRGRARLLGRRKDPLLRVDVTVDDLADLGQVRRRIEDGAVARVRGATELPELPVQVRLRVAAERVRRRVE